jgi:hypothetical protein
VNHRRRHAWILPVAIFLAAMPAFAANKHKRLVPTTQDGATIPIPRMKPAGLGKPGPDEVIPIPRAKPAELAGPALVAMAPGPGSSWSTDEVNAARAACGPLLHGLDLDWRPLDPIGSEGGCGTPAPIEVTAIAGVRLEPPATVNCRLAAKLHGWITGSVQPAALKDLKTQVEVIHTASSYVCRRRNNQATGKISEHAKADALDMAGFTFARSKDVTVADGWGSVLAKIGLSGQGSFLEDIHKDACTYFTTVLGPGSDAYHGNHFHVDTIIRNHDYRICQ